MFRNNVHPYPDQYGQYSVISPAKRLAAHWSNIHFVARYNSWTCRHTVACDFLRVTELLGSRT